MNTGNHLKAFCSNLYRYVSLFFLMSLFIFIQPSYSATITVNEMNDAINGNGLCSLREAIINANNNNQSGSTACTAGQTGPGVVDVIAVPAGTITLGARIEQSYK